MVFHFGHRFLNSFGVGFSWWDTARLFGQLLPSMGNLGYTFNIFIDLFLCTLLFFFMNYKPKKVFTDKKIIIFRLLFILPVLYEVAGILIKYFMGVGRLEVPSFAFFLLPSKPPLLFLAFVLIVLALKVGEVTFIKRHQGSTEAYEEHTKTNAHSLKMSIIISIIFLICAIIDFVVIFFIVIKCIQNAALIGTTEEEIALIAYQDINSWLVAGFGGAVSLIFVIPLVLLFSYKKEHKNPKIDTLLPIAGIALIAIVYIEGIFQVIVTNMPFVIERLKEWVNKYFGW